MKTDELRAKFQELAERRAAGDMMAGVELERLLDPGIRHRAGATERMAISRWLEIARCFGYATRDDSFGELEKLLSISFRRMLVAEAKLRAHGISLDDAEESEPACRSATCGCRQAETRGP